VAPVDGFGPDHHDTHGNLARERFADTHNWFWVSSTIGSVLLAIYLALAIPTYGWLPFLLVGLTALSGPLTLLVNHEIPERRYALSHVGWLVILGFTAAATGGAHSFLLPLLVAYTLGFFSRLAPKAACAYAVSAFALAVIPVLVTDWDGFLDAPWLLLSCTMGLLSMTPLAAQMAAGELRQRGEATIDQLTGLLNRRGLDERIAELSQQAMVMGDETPIAVVVGDLDHFKSVNDTYGHQRGDDVLRDVAYIIRKTLRRFELVYRMGGEEFLIVLPGHDLAAAAVTAEAVRAGIAAGRPGGLDVTISMGVAACTASQSDVAQLLAAADGALYAAKRAGRNRVLAGDTSSADRTDLPAATHRLPRGHAA
jgi:diguanylate cyclase (GGDEF)-like protein